uniref:Senescence domain-containing protein n=1 Tax=Triticum urartu TaxID=4572 RepID=A0A8R7RCY3_TRIUA
MTVDRLRWGQEVLRKRIQPGDTEAEVSPEMLRRIKRAKKVTKMSEKVATGILSGVVKLTSSVTSSLVNSKAGKKFFSLLPGEVILASLDGFGKISDAVEVAGKDVLSTSSTVTTGLVSHKYGEKAAAATNEGLDAAGHAIGTAWAVFKLRQALNPKSGLKPTSLAKSSIKAGAAELRAKSSKSK